MTVREVGFAAGRLAGAALRGFVLVALGAALRGAALSGVAWTGVAFLGAVFVCPYTGLNGRTQKKAVRVTRVRRDDVVVSFIGIPLKRRGNGTTDMVCSIGTANARALYRLSESVASPSVHSQTGFDIWGREVDVGLVIAVNLWHVEPTNEPFGGVTGEGEQSMKLAVLGAGSVGSLIARDLIERCNFHVILVDVDRDSLAQAERFGAETHCISLDDEDAWFPLLQGVACVVSAIPSHLGFATLKRLIEAGKNVVDLSFMPENFLELDELAKEKGVSVVADMGAAPGISHVLANHLSGQFSEVHELKIYVGGLPIERELPWQYKSPFASHDTIGSYVQHARHRVGGLPVEKPALSQREVIHVTGVGSLEAGLTDGLRSLLHTSKIPTMSQKTLRYPGSLDAITALRDSGFFSEQPMEIGGSVVRPVDVSAALLSEMWSVMPGDEDFTYLRVDVHGIQGNQPHAISAQLFDVTDEEFGDSSVARTMGFPAAIVAYMIAQGTWAQKGVVGPEALGEHSDVADAFFGALEERDMPIMFEELD